MIIMLPSKIQEIREISYEINSSVFGYMCSKDLNINVNNTIL